MLPAESDDFPRVAEAINSVLPNLVARGADDYVRPKVTLEIVQLSIECVDSTPECYVAVGRSLGVTRLLFAQISREPRKRKKSPTIKILLFDVENGSAIHTANRTFHDEQEALQGVKELAEQAVEGTSKLSTASGAENKRAVP